MKLPAQQMHELNDAQLNFEAIQKDGIFDKTTLGGDLSGTLPNPVLSTQGLQKFLQLVTPSAKHINIGSSSITFSTSAVATPQVVSHGLGVVPLYVGMMLTLGGTSTVISLYVGASSTTTFTAAGAASVSTNGTIGFYWIAIG